jgi:hypothetical protein
MTYKQVAALVGSIGIPYAYYQFPQGTAQACPFICFFFERSNDFHADNTNFQKIRPLSIELYTDNKDFALEETVEAVLNSNGLVYSREETVLDSEQMYMVTYMTEIVITEEN